MDENAQHCIVVPFSITNKDKLQIASASEKFDLNIDVKHEFYSLFYEVCEGEKFTMILLLFKQNKPLLPGFC
ncbi:hypothetical protein TUM17577_51200 [Enterobacter asburiae]|nr:hypothetical protein TUM17577_51200 [Enterobacter asburiae]